MLPITTTSSNVTPLQTPLINSAVPGSTVTHVPYDTVAPSVSNAQIDNNARGNSAVRASPTPTPPSATGTESHVDFSVDTAGPQSGGSSMQATFLTQLIAQDGSPETQKILLQYEKLVALGNVKYKPSNAFKPLSEPASVFNQLVHEDHASAPAMAAPAAEIDAQPAAAAQQQPAEATTPQTPPSAPAQAQSPSPRLADAYMASLQRSNGAASASVELA